MIDVIEIVDRGRGPQLSTSRITVQDLLPYYRERASCEEIRRWIPSLSDREINLLFDYIREHYEEVLQAEMEIKAKLGGGQGGAGVHHRTVAGLCESPCQGVPGPRMVSSAFSQVTTDTTLPIQPLSR